MEKSKPSFGFQNIIPPEDNFVNDNENNKEFMKEETIPFNADGKNKHQCPSCDKTYSKKGYLQEHFQSVHENLRHSCDICDKTFSVESTLRIHKQKKHNQIKCNSCNETFSLQENLQKHEDYFHNSLKMKCGYCKTKLEDLEKLQTHIQENHICEPCNRTFTQRGQLSRHVKAVHDKEKIKCEFCNKTYPWRAS